MDHFFEDPLSDKEFDELDRFLMSEFVSDSCMTMDALHGYLTALAIGPETIPPTEWLPRIWGEEANDAPKFQSEKESKRITHLIARFMNEIITTFAVAPKDYEPLFLVFKEKGQEWVDGEAWAWGFWEGVQLRAESWEEAESEDSEVGETLYQIYLLGADEVEEDELELTDTPQKVHELSLSIEKNIFALHQHFKPKRKNGVETVKREGEKLGRNDLCGCGSGKKYKVCCGAN